MVALGAIAKTMSGYPSRVVPFETLIEEVLRRENRHAAVNRGQATKGAPAADDMTEEEMSGSLRKAWPAIQEPLLQGTYVPAPVHEVQLPKPGGGTRMLGIPPCVSDSSSRRCYKS